MQPVLISDLLDLLETIEQSSDLAAKSANAFHDPNSPIAQQERCRARAHGTDASRLTVLLRWHGITRNKREQS